MMARFVRFDALKFDDEWLWIFFPHHVSIDGIIDIYPCTDDELVTKYGAKVVMVLTCGQRLILQESVEEVLKKIESSTCRNEKL